MTVTRGQKKYGTERARRGRGEGAQEEYSDGFLARNEWHASKGKDGRNEERIRLCWTGDDRSPQRKSKLSSEDEDESESAR